MSKFTKLLPTAVLAITAAQSLASTVAAAPLLMQFVQSDDYAEPAQLSAYAAGIADSIELQMMPRGCEGDPECWKKVCGTGSFCGRMQVDDTDQAC